MEDIMKKTYKLTIAYDGSRYFGWEHQPDRDTVQGKLESVLERMVGEFIDVVGAGRTDAGVHARAMTAHAVFETKMSCEEIRDYFNRYLPDDIAVRDVTVASERFHARYKAVGKTYQYTCFDGPVKPVFDRKYVTILKESPDVGAMQEAADYLTGEHDFRSFCGNPRMKKSTIRIVDTIEITKKERIYPYSCPWHRIFAEYGAHYRWYITGSGIRTAEAGGYADDFGGKGP